MGHPLRLSALRGEGMPRWMRYSIEPPVVSIEPPVVSIEPRAVPQGGASFLLGADGFAF